LRPPHTIIREPVHTAVWSVRPAGEFKVAIVLQELLAGS
jgi:hypothetical protein